jgi:predicted transposase YdaD
VGYDRYESPEALAALNELYRLLRLYTNCFLSVLKRESKTRVDGKLKKKYDPARTPYQRVLESPDVTEEAKAKLRETYQPLNPVRLRQQLDEQLERVWALAVR